MSESDEDDTMSTRNASLHLREQEELESSESDVEMKFDDMHRDDPDRGDVSSPSSDSEQTNDEEDHKDVDNKRKKDEKRADTQKEKTENTVKDDRSLTNKNTINETFQKILGINKTEENMIDITPFKDLTDEWGKKVNAFDKKELEPIFKKYKRIKKLEAKKLNIEILPALFRSGKKKETYMKRAQETVHMALSALATAITLIIEQQDESDLFSLTEILNDVATMLIGVHFSQTVTRRAFVLPLYKGEARTMLRESKISSYIFDKRIGRKLKSMKTYKLLTDYYKNNPSNSSNNGKRLTSLVFPRNFQQRQQKFCRPTTPPLYFQKQTANVQRQEGQQEKVIQETNNSTSSFDCRQSIRQAFINRGVPPEAAEIMIASIADSTYSQYKVALSQWHDFCVSKNISFFDLNVSNVLSFLYDRYKKGAKAGTINSIRSALSYISNNKIGEHPDICRFFKGISRIRPSLPKYKFTWDVDLLLKYLKEMPDYKDISLRQLTFKTVALIAICTAQRVQTIANIKLNNIFINKNGVIIKIDDFIKTSKIGKYQPLLTLPFLKMIKNSVQLLVLLNI